MFHGEVKFCAQITTFSEFILEKHEEHARTTVGYQIEIESSSASGGKGGGEGEGRSALGSIAHWFDLRF